MGNRSKRLLGSLIISFMAGVIGIVIIYKYFPQCLVRIVYDVHKSEINEEKIEKAVGSASQYIECFCPENSYLKSVVFHMGHMKEDEKETERGSDDFINVKLVNGEGKVLAESNMLLADISGISYQEFALEKWVEVDQQYKLLITFPGCEGVYATFGPESIGPGEHVSLMVDGEETDEILYMEYIYGTYSKKLLALWFLAFFLAASLVIDRVNNRNHTGTK